MAQIISKDRVPYRIWDKINGVWNKLNFTTNAKSVDADDGKTLETKVGALNGITSDLSCEDESIAISAKAVNDSLNQVNTNLSTMQNISIASLSIINGYEKTSGRIIVKAGICYFSANIKMWIQNTENVAFKVGTCSVKPKITVNLDTRISYCADPSRYSYNVKGFIDTNGEVYIQSNGVLASGSNGDQIMISTTFETA